ncbi:MAG TPA: DUF1002 domain-containing protein [Tissierellaceae bacterium]|nr:DUF1002 domain-containing protein [Tissierellaceae bacterium]
MKRRRFVVSTVLILTLILTFNFIAHADSAVVVTLAKDLNDKQRADILELFNVKEDEVNIIEVNNQEERRYLEGIAPEEQIGNITMSSAYVELLEAGSGIDVQTFNISWVTEDMYKGALVTAGVKDAKVMAAAPFSVSGTGALTGIIKAFEQATGEVIDEEQKRVANEEIVQTGELGEEIGKDKASELINKVKEEVVDKGVKSPEDIKKIIIEIAASLDINLNDEQLAKLTQLMEKISKLNINTDDIKEQLKGIGEKLDDVLKDNQEVKSILQKILDAIKNFFKSIFGK